MSINKSDASHGPYVQEPRYTLKKIAFAGADFSSIVITTSGLITLVQSPLKSIAMNLTKSGVFFTTGKPWSLPAIAALYRGSAAALTAGVTRSTYVVGSKNIATKEINLMESSLHENAVSSLEKNGRQESQNKTKKVEKKEGFMSRLPNVALITAGDVAVTQVSETKAQLIKAGLNEKSYKWNTMSNFSKLAKLGVFSRFSGSMINFAALCIATDFYAAYMPGDNQDIKQTLGGMLSGLTAAVASFPFSYYRDYLITKITVGQGELVAPKASQVIYDAAQNVKKMDKAELIRNARIIAINAGVRALTTGVTFAIVAGVSSALGSEPVSKLFNKPTEENHLDLKTQLKTIKKETKEAPEEIQNKIKS